MNPKILKRVKIRSYERGLVFRDGEFVATLPPGRYAFWKNVAQVKFVQQDLREAMLDVAGQDIMTSDVSGHSIRFFRNVGDLAFGGC